MGYTESMQILRLITRIDAPMTLDDAPDSLWRSILQSVEERVRAQGLPPPELLLVSPGALWQVPIESVVWPGLEPDAVTLFAGLGGQVGVQRRFRLSQIALGGRPGSAAAAVFELLPPASPGGPAGYRVALLPVTQQGGWQRVTAGWRESWGEDVTCLDPPLRRQVDLTAPQPKNNWPAGQRPPLHGSARSMPIPPPPNPVLLTRILVGDVLGDVLGNTEDRLEAFVFRPGVVERWHLRRGVPISVHDVLRNLVGSAGASAVVLVQPTVIELNGEILHAVMFMGELESGQRGGHVVPLRHDAAGRRVPLPAVAVQFPPGLQWIGVPPRVELNIQPADTGAWN